MIFISWIGGSCQMGDRNGGFEECADLTQALERTAALEKEFCGDVDWWIVEGEVVRNST